MSDLAVVINNIRIQNKTLYTDKRNIINELSKNKEDIEELKKQHTETVTLLTKILNNLSKVPTVH
jgi:hypothetical protein